MRLLDTYILSQTLRRLAVALGIVLLTLVLERVLRLFEFAAANNAAFGLVLQMTMNLLPHYLGLALPAAFFISVLLLMAQLGDSSEIDIMRGSGVSVGRMARPIILTGVLLSLLSLFLFGYAQPLTRYGYRAIRYQASNALWTDAISEQRFYAPAKGVTLLADEVDLDGVGFRGLFIHQIADDGTQTAMTAASGQVETDAAGQAVIRLEDVVRIDQQPDMPPLTYHLGHFTLAPDFPMQPAPFRPRGDDQRELTLGELWGRLAQPDADARFPVDRKKLDAEFHARLVRSASVALMPLLAVPMGMAAKRRRRGTAVATAAVMLLLYHYALQLGQGLVGMGAVSPLLGLWLPLALFALVCVNLFRRIDGRLRPDPFEALLDRADRLLQMLRPRSWWKGRAPE